MLEMIGILVLVGFGLGLAAQFAVVYYGLEKDSFGEYAVSVLVGIGGALLAIPVAMLLEYSLLGTFRLHENLRLPLYGFVPAFLAILIEKCLRHSVGRTRWMFPLLALAFSFAAFGAILVPRPLNWALVGAIGGLILSLIAGLPEQEARVSRDGGTGSNLSLKSVAMFSVAGASIGLAVGAALPI